MVSFLVKLFTKNKSENEKRAVTGKLCGLLGLLFNILLFAAKLVAGLLSGSIAIMADAFNNLSDAGSSVITLVGFRLSEKKPDHGHPFGHGRMEYVSGMVVSFMIILMGIELLKSAVTGLMEPSLPSFDLTVGAILFLSVLVKLYVFLYNRRFGREIGSAAMLATAQDSLADMLSTTVVLVSGVIAEVTSFALVDPLCGLILSVYVLYSGFRAARETVSPLLGQPPSAEFVRRVEEIAFSEPLVIGIHDMIVHDYGPGRVMVSLHCEVSSDEDVIALHEAIDGVECRIMHELNCMAIIHMDPVDQRDPLLAALREALPPLVSAAHASASYHDLRVVRASGHVNVIFDVLLPAGAIIDEKTVKKELSLGVENVIGSCQCIINFDTDYLSRGSE